MPRSRSSKKARSPSLPDTSKVTRFEVITGTGRALVRMPVRIELSLQDDGRTLKVFVYPTELKVLYASG